MSFPEMNEWEGGTERRGRSEGAGWKKTERQMVTMVTLKAAVCHNAYQENEPVRPDDRNAFRREVGTRYTEGSKLILWREMFGIRWVMVELSAVMVEGGKVVRRVSQINK